MRNPFEKEDHTGLYVGIAIGAAAGIALGWLYLTDKGAQYRRQISRTVKEGVSDLAATVIDQKPSFQSRRLRQRPKRSLKIKAHES